jgi:GTP pyrophosphokinase
MDEKKMIDEAFAELLKHYLSSNHRKKVDVIQKAFNFAMRAHENHHRESGEHFMVHPINVAMIVSKEMGLGSTSICAALLHDVIEGTDYTIDDIRKI